MHSAGICDSDVSVCPSQPVLYQNGKSQASNCLSQVMISSPSDSPHDFVFWQGMTHPKIRKGSARARAIYETAVGTNWRFWRFFDIYAAVSQQ